MRAVTSGTTQSKQYANTLKVNNTRFPLNTLLIQKINTKQMSAYHFRAKYVNNTHLIF